MEITSPADWDAAQELLGWFHDAVTRSLVFVNDERVHPDSSMEVSHGEAKVKAIIQTQSREHPGGQLTFRGVHSFNGDAKRHDGRFAVLLCVAGGVSETPPATFKAPILVLGGEDPVTV
jgi:hypothetical protein